MQFITPNIPFSFNYATADQTSGLFIRARIYDVTTGTPIFLSTTNLTEITNGYYFGDFTGVNGGVYLVIINVYTDGTFSTIDEDYSPSAEIFKSLDAEATSMSFNYGSFSHLSTLDIAALVYDVTSGIAVFQEKVSMPHLFSGVYFRATSGSLGHTYQVVKLVYEDNSFITVDPGFPPGTDTIQLLRSTNTIAMFAATLTGQKLKATLIGEDFQAILAGP